MGSVCRRFGIDLTYYNDYLDFLVQIVDLEVKLVNGEDNDSGQMQDPALFDHSC